MAESYPISGNLKLLMCKLWSAWRDYAADRRSIANFPPGKPIFVTGAHRSGTTWAAAMLAEPGVWYVHEPFNPNKGLWKRPFTYADPGTNNQDVNAYLSELLAGQHRSTSNNANTQHPFMPLRVRRPPIQRVLIKDPLACLLTGYIARHFDFEIIALIRHPAGFASSVSRLGWPVGEYLRQFLSDEPLMEQHLLPYAALLEKFQFRDDLEAASVLHGALNTVVCRQSDQFRQILMLKFEDLCGSPDRTFRALFDKFQMPYNEESQRRHSILCHHESRHENSYRNHEVKRNSQQAAFVWKSQLTSDQVTLLREIWEAFDLPFYRASTDW